VAPAGYGAIRRIRKLCAAAAVGAGTLGAPAAADPLTIVALGDSLTHGYGLAQDEGFVPQLQAWLAANGTEASVVNAGVSGDTTAGGLSRIDWALTPETDALIVELGGNDLLRGLPPEEARENLSGILDRAAERELPVLLIGLPAPANYGPEYQAAFDAIWPDLAAQYGTLMEPDFLAAVREAAESGTPFADLMQPDAIHPNAAGVALIVERIGPRVQELAARAEGRS
jgi:acyl-CoA thioesterase-1